MEKLLIQVKEGKLSANEELVPEEYLCSRAQSPWEHTKGLTLLG